MGSVQVMRNPARLVSGLGVGLGKTSSPYDGSSIASWPPGIVAPPKPQTVDTRRDPPPLPLLTAGAVKVRVVADRRWRDGDGVPAANKAPLVVVKERACREPSAPCWMVTLCTKLVFLVGSASTVAKPVTRPYVSLRLLLYITATPTIVPVFCAVLKYAVTRASERCPQAGVVRMGSQLAASTLEIANGAALFLFLLRTSTIGRLGELPDPWLEGSCTRRPDKPFSAAPFWEKERSCCMAVGLPSTASSTSPSADPPPESTPAPEELLAAAPRLLLLLLAVVVYVTNSRIRCAAFASCLTSTRVMAVPGGTHTTAR